MERVAAEYLEHEGFEILTMNYRCRIGEILGLTYDDIQDGTLSVNKH